MHRSFRSGLRLLVTAGVLAFSAGSAGASHQVVTIDFSSHGGGFFDPRFYESQGIVFPLEECSSIGCLPWFVSPLFQGDAALVRSTPDGKIEATFTSPVASLSLMAAPDAQGTAEYTLTAFGSGAVVGSTSVTVTQDTGDPEDTGFGYFRIELADLVSPATRFTLENRFIRSSFGGDRINFGVSSITYALADVPANSCGQVRGDGRLAGSSLARFVFDKVRSDGISLPTGQISFTDRGAVPRLHFASDSIVTLVISGRHVTLTGSGHANGARVDFAVEGDDSSPDVFSIRLSNGYSASGSVENGRGVNLKPCDLAPVN